MEGKKPTNPYQYTAVGDRLNTHFFTTVTDLVYEVKFIPSTEYFDSYSGLGVEVFEMTISISDNPTTGKKLPADERVAPTIFIIFEEFFLAKSHAIVFICDSTDVATRVTASLAIGFKTKMPALMKWLNSTALWSTARKEYIFRW